MCDLQFYPVIEIREQDLYLQELSHNLSNSKPLTAIKVSLIVEGVDDKKVNIWEAKVPKVWLTICPNSIILRFGF